VKPYWKNRDNNSTIFHYFIDIVYRNYGYDR